MTSIIQQFTHGGNTYMYYDVSSATQTQNAGLTFCYLFSTKETFQTLVDPVEYEKRRQLLDTMVKASTTPFVDAMRTQLGDDTLVDDKALYGMLGLLNNLQRDFTIYIDFARACEKALDDYKIIQSYTWGKAQNPLLTSQPQNAIIGNVDAIVENPQEFMSGKGAMQDVYFGWEPEASMFYPVDVLNDGSAFTLKTFCTTTSASPGVLTDKIADVVNSVVRSGAQIRNLSLSLPKCGQDNTFLTNLSTFLMRDDMLKMRQNLKNFSLDLTGNLTNISLLNDVAVSLQDQQWSLFGQFFNGCSVSRKWTFKISDQNNYTIFNFLSQFVQSRSQCSFDFDVGNSNVWDDSFGVFITTIGQELDNTKSFSLRCANDLVGWSSSSPVIPGTGDYSFSPPVQSGINYLAAFSQFSSCTDFTLIFDNCFLRDVEVQQITQSISARPNPSNMKNFTLQLSGGQGNGHNFGLQSLRAAISAMTSLENLSLTLESDVGAISQTLWDQFYAGLALPTTLKTLKISTGATVSNQNVISGLLATLQSTLLSNLSMLDITQNHADPVVWSNFSQIVIQAPNIKTLRLYASTVSEITPFIQTLQTMNLVEFSCNLGAVTDQNESDLQVAIGRWPLLRKFKTVYQRHVPDNIPIASHTDAFLTMSGLDLDIAVTMVDSWDSDQTNSLSAKLLRCAHAATKAKICVLGGSPQPPNTELQSAGEEIKTSWNNVRKLQLTFSTLNTDGVNIVWLAAAQQSKLKVFDITTTGNALGQDAVSNATLANVGQTYLKNLDLVNLRVSLSPTTSVDVFVSEMTQANFDNVVSLAVDVSATTQTDTQFVPKVMKIASQAGQLSNLEFKMTAVPDVLASLRMLSMIPVVASGSLVRLFLQIRNMDEASYPITFFNSLADAIVSNRMLEELTYDISQSTVTSDEAPFDRMYSAFKQLSYLNINITGTSLPDASIISLAQQAIEGFRTKKKIILLDLRSTLLTPTGVNTVQGYMTGMNTLYPQWKVIFTTS